MKINLIDISKLESFNNHPFKVQDDLDMEELEQSIINNGLLEPIIVRHKRNDKYEIISGHRRVFALNKIGIKEVPCIVKELTDNQAIIEMVDSNIKREFILPDAMIASNQDFPSFNMYVYASNNPIMNTDMTGYGIFKMIAKK